MTYALKDHNRLAGNILVIGSPFSHLGQYACTAIGGYIATDTPERFFVDVMHGETIPIIPIKMLKSTRAQRKAESQR